MGAGGGLRGVGGEIGALAARIGRETSDLAAAAWHKWHRCQATLGYSPPVFIHFGDRGVPLPADSSKNSNTLEHLSSISRADQPETEPPASFRLHWSEFKSRRLRRDVVEVTRAHLWRLF